MQNKYKSENTNNKKLCSQIYIQSSRNICRADLEDCIGKEELYLRKLTIFDV